MLLEENTEAFLELLVELFLKSDNPATWSLEGGPKYPGT